MRASTGICVLLLTLGACGAGEGAEPTALPESATTAVAVETTEAMPAPGSATTSTTSAPVTAPATTTSTTAAPALSGPGFDTWIAVLASLPTTDYDKSGAEAYAADLGVPGAGVLLSDDYASLNAGYWVVYRGGYDFQWEASQACDAAANAAPDCYVRHLAGVDPAQAVGRSHGTAFGVTALADFVIIDLATGVVLRTIALGYDAESPGHPALHPTGATVYYSVGFEDFWFSCDASDGMLMELDLAGGRAEQVGDGFSPAISSDGATLMYLASSECFPDPAEPQFVLAPIDAVVWRDLTDGTETRVVLPPAGEQAEGYELWTATLGPDGSALVLDTAGVVWRVTREGAVAAVFDLAAQFDMPIDGHSWTVVGHDRGLDRLLVAETTRDGDDGRTLVHGLDLVGGTAETYAAYSGDAGMALDVLTGSHLAAATGRVLQVDGETIGLSVDLVDIAW